MGRRRAERVRLGHERPGAVLRGPPVTVTCDCGDRRNLAYGEVWTCERCARRWNTNQIPEEQYAAIRRTQLRYRVLPVLLGLIVSGAALFFLLTGNVFSMLFLLPISLIAWFTFIRPAHRRSYRRAISELPRWELHPE